ncbi:MAG: type II toxin-antitoxin system RelE/ParE family toxin [Syntrophales bacterium LBB04]|nr:type II toxin-antitoxin system RelE/ParE family toxin [Syntrophales bacterium LBB04]
MAKIILWSPKAAESIEDICNFIAKDSEYYAAMFAKKIVAIIENIALFPKAGRVVPEYQDENLREKIFQSYRIVYRLKEDFIEIVVITHGSRQLNIE